MQNQQANCWQIVQLFITHKFLTDIGRIMSVCLSISLSVTLCTVALKVWVQGWKLYQRVPAGKFIGVRAWGLGAAASMQNPAMLLFFGQKLNF